MRPCYPLQKISCGKKTASKPCFFFFFFFLQWVVFSRNSAARSVGLLEGRTPHSGQSALPRNGRYAISHDIKCDSTGFLMENLISKRHTNHQNYRQLSLSLIHI